MMLRTFLLAGLCHAALVSVHAEKFYVAVSGKDGATSSKARPLKTIQAAVEAALRANRAPSHTIFIGAGTYQLDQPITINAGSASGARLILCAEDPSQPPVLDGANLPPVADAKATLDALLTIKGGSVSLEHLKFIHTPGHGIVFEKVNPFHIRQCEFSDIHGHAIRHIGAVEGTIEYCQIQGVDGTGIFVTGGDRPTLTASKTLIAHNQISQVNRWKGAGSLGNGIFVEGVGLTVRNNTITDSVEPPWTMGIRVSGNNHVVEKNRLHHVAHEDAGAIYIGGRDLARRGNIVRFNLIEDCSNGVYLDDRASGNIVTGNIILRAKAAVFIGGGQDNTITKNAASQSGAFLKMDNRGMGWTALKDPFKDDYSRLQTFLGDAAVKSLYFKIYPGLSDVTAENALQPSGNIVAENFAEAGTPPTQFTDMDKVLGGRHQTEYEKWNKLDAPRPVTLPKDQPIELKALGAPGLITSQIGAQPPPAAR